MDKAEEAELIRIASRCGNQESVEAMKKFRESAAILASAMQVKCAELANAFRELGKIWSKEAGERDG